MGLSISLGQFHYIVFNMCYCTDTIINAELTNKASFLYMFPHSLKSSIYFQVQIDQGTQTVPQACTINTLSTEPSPLLCFYN